MSKMTKKRKQKKVAKSQGKAGPENLAKWKKENPEKAKETAMRHGAFSKQIRQRYSDKRTREGKALALVIKGLIADLGGASNLSSAQCLIIDNIKSKLIVLFQIGKHVDQRESIISDQGELIPCLGRNYTSYAESLRRDLEVLFAIKRKTSPISYDRAMKALEGGET